MCATFEVTRRWLGWIVGGKREGLGHQERWLESRLWSVVRLKQQKHLGYILLI